jgi:hypothetical protein
MPDSGTLPQIDVSAITDPDVRRAFRSLLQVNQAMTTRIQQQQQEIEALLQMMVEKHVGSIGEFKRHMIKLQSADPRSERLHGQIAGHAAPVVGHTAPAVEHAHATTPQQPVHRRVEIAEPEVDGHRRYTL